MIDHTSNQRWRLLVAYVVASAVIGAAGCSQDDSQADPPGTDDTGSAESADATDETELPEGTERLVSRYAHYDVVAYESDDMKTLIISYGFTDLDLVDGELLATESFCFSEHRSDQPIEVQLSDVATQAIQPPTTPVEVSEENGRLSFFRPETPSGIGVTLENPFEDPLPTDRDDPRLSDDDGDGKPGVTATIRIADGLEGEIYIARREIFAYDVTEQGDGTLVGVVLDRSEQLVIGASDDIFITDAEWVQHPDLDKSPIILIPVDRSWDCERLAAERPRIFPPTPEVDW